MQYIVFRARIGHGSAVLNETLLYAELIDKVPGEMKVDPDHICIHNCVVSSHPDFVAKKDIVFTTENLHEATSIYEKAKELYELFQNELKKTEDVYSKRFAVLLRDIPPVALN